METPKIIAQQSAPPTPKHHKYMHNRYIVPAILVLLVIVGGAYLAWHHFNPSNSYPYTYNQTQAYKLPGSQPGRGIAFDKPDVFANVAPNEDFSTHRGFEQVVIPLDKKSIPIIYS